MQGYTTPPPPPPPEMRILILVTEYVMGISACMPAYLFLYILRHLHEYASPSEDWASHLKVHISINVQVVTFVVGLQLGSFAPTINRERKSLWCGVAKNYMYMYMYDISSAWYYRIKATPIAMLPCVWIQTLASTTNKVYFLPILLKFSQTKTGLRLHVSSQEIM